MGVFGQGTWDLQVLAPKKPQTHETEFWRSIRISVMGNITTVFSLPRVWSKDTKLGERPLPIKKKKKKESHWCFSEYFLQILDRSEDTFELDLGIKTLRASYSDIFKSNNFRILGVYLVHNVMEGFWFSVYSIKETCYWPVFCLHLVAKTGLRAFIFHGKIRLPRITLLGSFSKAQLSVGLR